MTLWQEFLAAAKFNLGAFLSVRFLACWVLLGSSIAFSISAFATMMYQATLSEGLLAGVSVVCSLTLLIGLLIVYHDVRYHELARR